MRIYIILQSRFLVVITKYISLLQAIISFKKVVYSYHTLGQFIKEEIQNYIQTVEALL